MNVWLNLMAPMAMVAVVVVLVFMLLWWPTCAHKLCEWCGDARRVTCAMACGWLARCRCETESCGKHVHTFRARSRGSGVVLVVKIGGRALSAMQIGQIIDNVFGHGSLDIVRIHYPNIVTSKW